VAKIYSIEGAFLYRDQRKKRKAVAKDYIDSAAVAAMIGLSVRMVSHLAERYEESGGIEGIPSFRPGKRKRSQQQRPSPLHGTQGRNGIWGMCHRGAAAGQGVGRFRPRFVSPCTHTRFGTKRSNASHASKFF
jgi:hypothetical protein